MGTGLGLTSALNISTNALQVTQSALGTISHNVANVNSDGYARQILSTVSTSASGIGSGVDIQSISRQVDNVLNSRVATQASKLSYQETKLEQMRSIESILGSVESGVDKLFSNFFSDLNTLSNNTDSNSQKLNTVQAANLLTETIRSIDTELGLAATNVDDRINTELSNLNTALARIAELNNEIATITNGGSSVANANDLMDERQRQIDFVSERLKVKYVVGSNNSILMSTETGRRLVDGNGYVELSRGSGTPYSNIVMQAVNPNGSLSSTEIELDTDQLTAGSIKALVDVRDTVIGNLTSEFDELASELIDEFNKIHSQGTGVPPSQTITSGNSVANATTDLFSALSADLASDTFDISVVNASTGAVVSTTVGGAAVSIPAAGPFTMNDLVTLINNSAPGLAGEVTASTTTDSDGNTVLQMTTSSGQGVVLSNGTGNPLGILGTNNFFTGSDASDIAVRSDIQATPALLATARMRSSDGGLSSLDNSNVLELAQMSDTEFGFDAAGNQPSQTESFAGYASSVISSFAVSMEDAVDRVSFNESVLNNLRERQGSVSGVNLDEELANLLVFQNSFQASARMIGVVNDLFDVLFTSVR